MRVLASALLPLVAAACTSFGIGSSPSSEPELPPEADAADAQPLEGVDGGSETEERDALADSDALPEAASCVVIRDDFEDDNWKPDDKWNASVSSTGASWGRTSGTPPSSPGSSSLSLVSSVGGAFVRLGQPIEQRCTLRFEAWLFVSSHNSVDSRILSIETTDGARIDVVMRAPTPPASILALVENGTQRGTVPLVTQAWVRLVFTYTLNAQPRLRLGAGDLISAPLMGRGPAKRFDFGLLGAESGTEQILFDDVELEF